MVGWSKPELFVSGGAKENEVRGMSGSIFYFQLCKAERGCETWLLQTCLSLSVVSSCLNLSDVVSLKIHVPVDTGNFTGCSQNGLLFPFREF